jgi:hypothetical protein
MAIQAADSAMEQYMNATYNTLTNSTVNIWVGSLNAQQRVTVTDVFAGVMVKDFASVW